MNSKPGNTHRTQAKAEKPVRARVLTAAFKAFAARGFKGASTIEIAQRAGVSKREIYALFRNKEGVFAACIAERAERMRQPISLEIPANRDELARTLIELGVAILRERTDPVVLSIYRLVIAESQHLPGIAKTLDALGREPLRLALADFLRAVQSRRLLGPGDPVSMGSEFLSLLCGDLLLQLLLGRVTPPSRIEAERRASAATNALLALHPDATTAC